MIEFALLCTKSPGLFDTELIFDVLDESGKRTQFFVDECWSVPFGVRVDVREVSPCGTRMLVGLPNGQGSVIVKRSQLVVIR